MTAGTTGAHSARIHAFDLARALAICAMILENYKVDMLGQRQEPHLLVWLAGLTDGRSAPLFVLLAGVGISLFVGRSRASSSPDDIRAARKVLLVRSLFFFAVSDLFIRVWPMDILHFFAAYFFLAAVFFLGASGRTLLWSAAGITVVSTVEMAWRGESYFEHLDYSTFMGWARDTFLDGIHPVLPWLAFVLVGMWLGRLDLRDRVLRQRLLLGAIVTATLAEVASVALCHLSVSGIADLTPARFPHLFTTRLSPPGPLYVISASATAIAAIVICFALVERFPRNVVVRSLVAAGQLSLTLYIGHAVVGAGALYALGRLDDHSIWFVLAYWLGYFVLSVAFATWWRGRYALGPVEWVMRAVSGNGPKPAGGAGAEEPGHETERARRGLVWASVVAGALGLGGVLSIQLLGLPGAPSGCGERVVLRPGDRHVGVLTATCHMHWLEVDLAHRQTLTITVDSNLDSYLEAFDATGEHMIAEDDDSGPGYNPLMRIDLEPGRTRLLLRPYRSGTGTYAVQVR